MQRHFQACDQLLGLGDHVGFWREVVVSDAKHFVATRLEKTPIKADNAALLAANQALAEGNHEEGDSVQGMAVMTRYSHFLAV